MLKIPPKIEYVINSLCENNFEAYVVGGCVRDMLMGKEPTDYDITTSATPEQVIGLFDKTVPTGIKHGTVTVIIDKENIEVTTFRTEDNYNDNRHPDNVKFVKSIKEDLARRDFTANAIAFNKYNGIVDFYGGQKDINNRILRAVGDPKIRFCEDALRILRLFRFSSVLEFEIEDNTLNSALELCFTLENISRERILVELQKAVCGKNSKALLPLIKAGGLKFLQIKDFMKFDILENLRENQSLCFFAFLYFSDCDVLKTAEDLKMNNKFKNYSKILLNLLTIPFPKNKAEIKEMLAASDPEIFEDYLTLIKYAFKQNTDDIKILLQEILNNKEPYLISHLCLNGNDLKDIGICNNNIGIFLEKIRKIVVESPEKNNKDFLLNFSKNH